MRERLTGMGVSPDMILAYIRESSADLAETLRYEHRTHQQSTIGAILHILHQHGLSDHDMRNKASVEWCHQNVSEPVLFPYL